MLSAASENVLMAVQACAVDRLWPSRGNVTQQTRPTLSVGETTIILDLLAGDGYVRKDHDGAYVLTDRGRAEADRVVARG